MEYFTVHICFCSILVSINISATPLLLFCLLLNTRPFTFCTACVTALLLYTNKYKLLCSSVSLFIQRYIQPVHRKSYISDHSKLSFQSAIRFCFVTVIILFARSYDYMSCAFFFQCNSSTSTFFKIQVKVKIIDDPVPSLLTEHHAVKAYWGVEV
jgi:hypothetical protein